VGAALLVVSASGMAAQHVGGTLNYAGTVLPAGQSLDFGHIVPGVGSSVLLTDVARRGQYGVAYNARSVVTIRMADGGRFTQVDPEPTAAGEIRPAHFVPGLACRWADGDASGPSHSGTMGPVLEECLSHGTSSREMALDLDPDGRLSYRWILLGGTIEARETAYLPAGRYVGTAVITIRRASS